MITEEYQTAQPVVEAEEVTQIDFAKYLKGIWKRKWIPVLLAIVVAVPFYLKSGEYVPIYRAEVTVRGQQIGKQAGPVWSRDRLVEMQSSPFVSRVAAQSGLAISILDSVYKTYDHLFSIYYTTEDPLPALYKIIINNANYQLYMVEGPRTAIVDSANVWEAINAPRTVNGLTFSLNPALAQGRHNISFKILPFSKAISEIRSNVHSRTFRNNNVLVLSMEGSNPDMLACKLNRIAEVYIDETIRLKTRDESKYRELLEAKLGSSEQKVKEVEEELRRFYQQYPLSLNAEKEKFLNQLKDADEALAELPRQREQLSDLLDQYEKEQDVPDPKRYRRFIIHQIAKFPAFADEPHMSILRQTLDQFEQEYEQFSGTLSPIHKRLVELDNNILDTHRKIIDFASRYRNTLAEKVVQYRENLKDIQAQLKTLPNDEYRLMELERIKKVNENLYTSLFTELNNLEVADAAKTEELAIMDHAIPPTTPTNVSTNQKVLLGGGAGFFVGLLICIVLEFFNTTIVTPDDVNKYLKLNVIGIIPVVDFKDIPEYHDFEKVKQIDHQLVTHDYSPTPIGESYRALRTHLMFSKNTGRIQTLVLTSIRPEEGKSFTACNLAIILAQQRTNTLLVDADLRRGVLHNTFSVKKIPGLTNYLSNNATLSSIVQQTHVPNLSVIACGAMIPNPSELLGSLQMRRFLEESRRKFDIVVFDTPPLDAATDAVVLGSQADAVTIIVRAGKTNYKIAQDRLEIFKTIPANLIGVILNGSENALLENYYSYYHY